MPEVAALDRRRVAAGEQFLAGERREHPQVRGPRLMQPGEQPVDRPQPALRRDDVIGPASAAVSIARTTVVPAAITRPPFCLVRLTRQNGGRVIAAGTTVVRAIETAALAARAQGADHAPGVAPAAGWTCLL